MTRGTIEQQITLFLDGRPHAVIGASANRAKYGNKALRAYIQSGRPVFPVNPHEAVIEGLRACASLRDIPESVHAISIVTPPPVTERVVREALELGIEHIWMQPGAQSDEAVALARGRGANVIAGDACVLVVLGYREH